MNNREDALEAGLRALADGKSIQEAVSGSPDLRDELAPLLGLAVEARRQGAMGMPADLKRRMRSRFLQRAAQMRERSSHRQRRVIPMLPRLAITLGLVGVLVLTSTGLVGASSTAVPGDQLYTVKRSWEDLRLLLSAQPNVRYLLASQFEQERLDEIKELLLRGRAAPITFSGVVSLKQGGDWIVSGIPVAVPSAAVVPSGAILEGQPVLVSGVTRGDGIVVASVIRLLREGTALPPLGPSLDEAGEHQAGEPQDESEGTQPVPAAANSSPPYVTYQFTGIVEKFGTDTWQVNQQQVSVVGAIIIGSIDVGSEIKFEGYYVPNGTFVATRIEATSDLRHDDGESDAQVAPESRSNEDAGQGSDQEAEHEAEP